jgi:hypothetical protein
VKITKSQLKKIIKEELGRVISESWADMMSATKESGKLEREGKVLASISAWMDPNSTDEHSFIQYAGRDEELDGGDIRSFKKILKMPDPDRSKKALWRTLGPQLRSHIEKIYSSKKQYTEEPWLDVRALQLIWDLDEPGQIFNYVMTEYIGDVLLSSTGEFSPSAAISKGYIDPEDPGF